MRKRHTPMRSCVGCRSSLPKRDLIRVVREPSGTIDLDLTGKRSGRGVYLCPNKECLDKVIKGRQLERALQTKIDPEIVERLQRVLHEQSL